VQDAAYGTLLREPRHALHARIADALENQFPKIAESKPELLARHCTEAGLTGWHTPVACQELVAAAPVVVSASPEELDEEGWALRRELVDRESHISLLALTNSR